jgi:hypothetical protein
LQLGVDAASGHVAILGHRYLRVPKVIGTDPCRQPFVVDERRDCLAERVSREL